MIKARGTMPDGRPLVLIGLSELNVSRLREGKPIAFELEEIGLEGHVIIMHGATEDDIRVELASAGITFKAESDRRPRSKRG